jgi:hypothetical protein
MQRIDKSAARIVATKYKTWVDELIATQKEHNGNYRYYYNDVVMNLYLCQNGVCAYTEMRLCYPEMYSADKWEKGRYKLAKEAEEKRTDHLGELEHYDPTDKISRFWNWDNLFMIHAKINGIKSAKPALPFLKPDLPEYSPDQYFDYDEKTHRFSANTDIEDDELRMQIQNVIDNVLLLNHGTVLNERRNYVNEVSDKRNRGQLVEIDRFYTAVSMSGV